MRRALVVLAAVLALAAGCKKAQSSPPPPSFAGPAGVAYGCLDTHEDPGANDGIAIGQHFVKLEACDSNDDGRAIDDRFHQVAFVIQRDTGEVAAVDLTANTVLDSSVIIPGYTTVRAGELPSGIATSDNPQDENGARVVFVSNLGTRSVQSISATDFWYRLDPSFAPAGAGAVAALPDGPTDLAYYDAGGGNRFLFAPLPNAGQVAQIVVKADGSFGGVTLLPVGTTVPAPVASTPGPEYERLCPVTATSEATNPPVNARAASAAPRAPVSLGTSARPVRLRVVDGPSGRELLVADEALPLIHRFGLSPTGAAELAPIVTGVPTTDFVVTPLVPAEFRDDPTAQLPATERYLYAIDATDDSVLVVDFTSRTSPSFGAVLPVAVGDTVPDRIPLPTPARHLEVIRADYVLDASNRIDPKHPACNVDLTGTGTAEAPHPDPTFAQPGYLRGVFVAIATSDGSVRYSEIYDLDATCRGGRSGGVACAGPLVAGDSRVAIRRHRLRISSLLTRAPSIVGAPNAAFDTQSGSVQYSGTVSSVREVSLVPFAPDAGGCPGDASAEMLEIYPDLSIASTTGPLICVLDDAHDAVSSVWNASYEGVIPHTAGALGRLTTTDGSSSGSSLLAPDAHFCERGVLGKDDVAASGLDASLDPEAGYEGDMLVVTSVLPWETENDPACATWKTKADGTRAFIGFPILAASDTKLVLDEPIAPTVTDVPKETLLDSIRRCFPGTLAYTVNAYASFVVSSTTVLGPQFRHRVVSSGGACRVDRASYPVDPANPDSYRNSRARFGHVFIHPQVAFHLGDAAPETLARDRLHDVVGRLSFTVTNTPGTLRTDSSRLPEGLGYAPGFSRFFVLDGQLNQMVVMGVHPLRTVTTLR